jgi:hypothetical protein
MISNAFSPSQAMRDSFLRGGSGGRGRVTTDTAMQGWSLPAPGDDVKNILLRQRAGERLSDRDWQRLSQRVAAENDSARSGNSVDGAIQPRKLTPVELGQRDRARVVQDQQDLAEYSAGRGFPVKPSGPSPAVLAARANGTDRAGSGGIMTRGDAMSVVQPTPVADATGATSGGTITTGGVTKSYAGRPGVQKTPSSAPANTVPLSGAVEEGDSADDEETDESALPASTNARPTKARRDIVGANRY